MFLNQPTPSVDVRMITLILFSGFKKKNVRYITWVMILHGIEYQRPTSLNMHILADHVTYSFLAFPKSIFHFCLGCYCGGYSQNGRSNLSSFILFYLFIFYFYFYFFFGGGGGVLLYKIVFEKKIGWNTCCRCFGCRVLFHYQSTWALTHEVVNSKL